MEPTAERIRDRFGRFISRSQVQAEVADSEEAEAPEVAGEETPQQEPVAPEPPKTYWEEQGFIPDTANLCFWLEELEPSYLYPPAIRHIIQVLDNSSTVTDLDYLSQDEISNHRHALRETIPRVEREMMTFDTTLSRVRTVQDDHIDYI